MPILVYLLTRIIPYCTLLSLHQLDAAYNERLKSLVRRELRERRMAALATHIPPDDMPYFLEWFRIYSARVVGESAAWVCAGRRSWDPSSLDMIIPYGAYNECFARLQWLWPAAPKGPGKSLLPSREGPMSHTFILTGNRIISIRRAPDRPTGLFHALTAQPLTVQCAFFDLAECVLLHPDLHDREALLPTTVFREPVRTAHCIANWVARGWNFYSSTGVEQWHGPCGTACPDLNRGVANHRGEIPLLCVEIDDPLNAAPSMLHSNIRWRLGGPCYNSDCPRCMFKLSILRDRFLRVVRLELERIGHPAES